MPQKSYQFPPKSTIFVRIIYINIKEVEAVQFMGHVIMTQRLDLITCKTLGHETDPQRTIMIIIEKLVISQTHTTAREHNA